MLAALFLVSIVLIAGKSVYLGSIPVWVYIVNLGLPLVAIMFAILESRREKGAKAPKERASQ